MRPTVEDRQPESDEQFIAYCDLPPHPRAPEIALVIRRAIATHGHLNVETIHALNRIPEDLGDIFIRESLTVVEFIMILEEDLDVRIPNTPVSDLLGRETVAVKEIVETITALVLPKLQ